jgi:hypothetical protein
MSQLSPRSARARRSHRTGGLVRGLAAAAVLATAAGAQLLTATSASAATTTVVSVVSGIDATAHKSVRAECPPGTRVYGGGGEVSSNGISAVTLTELYPTAAVKGSLNRNDAFIATADNDPQGTFAGSWSLRAYAVCGPALANYSIQQGMTTSTSSGRLELGANCPAGTAPFGLGARIGGGNGGVVLNSLLGNYTPNAFGVRTGFYAAKAFARDNVGTWSLTPSAVCATPPALPSYRFVDAVNTGSSPKSITAGCPTGTSLYGLGGYLSYLSGDTTLTSLRPSGQGTFAKGVAAPGFTNPWWVTAEAICL